MFSEFPGTEDRESSPERKTITLQEFLQTTESSSGLEYLADYVEQMQEISSISFKRPIHFHVSKNVEASVTDSSFEGELGFSELSFPESTSDFVILHEVAHRLLDQRLSEIEDPKIASALAEGFSDLLAYDVLHEDRDEFIEAVVNGAGGQRQTVDLTPEMTSKFLSDDFGESSKEFSALSHIAGRNFVTKLVDEFPDEPFNRLFSCVLEYTPTRKQIVDPESYVETLEEHLDEFPENPDVETKRAVFRDDRLRVI